MKALRLGATIMSRRIRIWSTLEEACGADPLPRPHHRRPAGDCAWGMAREDRHRAYTPGGLDRAVTTLALVIVLILGVVVGFELCDRPADQVEWLNIAARLVAYDKPL